MALVSLITLAVMIAGALVLGLSAHHEDIHMKSVLLDTLQTPPRWPEYSWPAS